ncbi:hypothetical protein D3C73_283980 [compost metagenome]
MIIAIVSPSTAVQDQYIKQVMDAGSGAYRFSVQGHHREIRCDVLLSTLRRDAKNTVITTLVPVTTSEEVQAIRLMDGFVGHIYGVAHPSILIERHDLILASPASSRRSPRRDGHLSPSELCAELRTRLLAHRDRFGRG